MPIANLNRELQLHRYDPEVKAVIQALGEIYSNKNLGLNVRVLSGSNTLHETDAIIYTSGGASNTITLPSANKWASRDVLKSPILILWGTGSPTVSHTISLQSGDVLLGPSTFRGQEIRILISNGNTAWVTVGGFCEVSVNFTPVVSAGSGTITTASANMAYTVRDHYLTFESTITITTNGTGATYVNITLPIAATVVTPIKGVNSSNGVSVGGFVTGSNCRIYSVTGTYPAASGTTLVVQGTYRIS